MAVQYRATRRIDAEARVNLARRRAWYDETQPANGDATGTKGGAADAQGQTTGGSDSAKFTQADLDRIISERVKRAQEAASAELLKRVGVEKPEDLETLVNDARKRQDAEKTEAQKLQEALEKANKRAEEAEASAAKVEAQRIEDARQGAVSAAATKANAANAEDVVMWVQKNATDDYAKAIGEDGKVDEKKVAALVEACKKARPHYFRSARPPGVPSNNGNGSSNPEPDKAAKDAARTGMARQIRSNW